jgi:hypothetical protein
MLAEILCITANKLNALRENGLHYIKLFLSSVGHIGSTNMAVPISQTTMDLLTQRRDTAQQKLADAQNEVTAAQASRTTQQRLLSDLNALIADSTVVP